MTIHRPSPGFMGMHNQTPFEFLYLVSQNHDGEVWLCRPLFVSHPINRTTLFRPGDRLTPLHSQCK
jgi:hypothetical protein